MVDSDLGSSEQRSFDVMVSVEELADSSFHARGYVRETETDNWRELNGAGSNAVDTEATFRLEGVFRYVRIAVVTTGSTPFESSVIGF